MIQVIVSKEEDSYGRSKSFPLESGTVEILHDQQNGKDVVRVTINGRIEFEYDVNNPEKEVVGYFTSKEEMDEIKKSFPEGSITII